MEQYKTVRIRKTIYDKMQKFRGKTKWDTFFVNCLKTYTKNKDIPLETMEVELINSIRRVVKHYKSN